MGAHGFSLTIEATNEQKFKDHFNREVEEDRHENGCGAYSGSIGQKSGYRLVSRTPVTPERCSALQERNEGDKWDSFAMACPVVKMEVFGKTKTFTKTVNLEPQSYHVHRWHAEADAKNVALKQMPVSSYEIIGDVTVEKVSAPTYKVVKCDDVPTGWKVQFNGQSHRQSEPFPTKAEALKYAKAETAKSGIYAEVFNHGGAYKRVVSKPGRWKVSFKYKETRATDKISHYEVWGWAAD